MGSVRSRSQAVAIVQTRLGNLLSVCNALSYLGAEPVVCETPDELSGGTRVVIPGVGAFRDAMEGLVSGGFVEALNDARSAGVPILGICLGMQLMARRSFEGGESEGLGWFEADVVRLEPDGMRVPQVGWNDTSARVDSPLFRNLPPAPDFYYLHSYALRCDDEAVVDATCDYGGEVTAAVRSGNVAAVQFHPEKSQDYGLTVLDNFLGWEP